MPAAGSSNSCPPRRAVLTDPVPGQLTQPRSPYWSRCAKLQARADHGAYSDSALRAVESHP